MERPRLDDVTLCCIDTAQPLAALRALSLSLRQCDFARALFLTDQPVAADGITVRPIPRIMSGLDYARLVMRDLARHIETDYVLLIQWDGWVLDGSRWEDGFRAVDYIGAPWDWHTDGMTVGNGGFSLRSRRLLDALAGAEFPPAHPEDDVICRRYRPALEQRGIRFGDRAMAGRFAFERSDPPGACFGFHGAFNFWRTISAEDLPGVLDLLAPETLRSVGVLDLLAICVGQGRWQEAHALVERIMARWGKAAILEALAQRVTGATPDQILSAVYRYGAARSQ